MDIKAFQAIHHLVPPKTISSDLSIGDEIRMKKRLRQRNTKGEKRPTKKRNPSIRDSRNSTLLVLSEFQNVIEEVTKFATIQVKEKKLLFHPIMVVVLDGRSQPKKFYVSVEKFMNEVESFIHCLNTYFKTFWLFDLGYPMEGSRSCMFIQELFFGLKSPDSGITSIISDLKRGIESGKF